MNETLPEQRVCFPQVTDMMLQDQNYPGWGVAARRFWKRGNNRIVLFWYVLSGRLNWGGEGTLTPFIRQSISVLISLQSVSAPLIRGNQWTRQGRGGQSAALPLTPRGTSFDPRIAAKHSKIKLTAVYTACTSAALLSQTRPPPVAARTGGGRVETRGCLKRLREPGRRLPSHNRSGCD